MTQLISLYRESILKLNKASGIGPLFLRLYLAPVFMQAGYHKLANFEATADWFGNPDWGLGLPFPELMAALAGSTELVGGALLIPGLAVRFVSIPLIVTMLVAIFSVHWENGWLAISDASSWLANDRVSDSVIQRGRIVEILKENGNYDWLTQNGSVTILNNGIEFSVTYLVMLISLLFTGAGHYTSFDYLVHQYFSNKYED